MTASSAQALGYEVHRAIVPPQALDRALRHVHLDIVRHGLPQEWLSQWLWNAHWFPHLRWDAEIVSLLDHLPEDLKEGEMCDPQILLQMPDEAEEVELEPHVDHEPGWANGRRYRRIIGVALTRNEPCNGGLTVWPLDGGEPSTVELDPGDILVMDPALPHASGLNHTAHIRYAVYFRFLEPA
jgi:hypothetical protein